MKKSELKELIKSSMGGEIEEQNIGEAKNNKEDANVDYNEKAREKLESLFDDDDLLDGLDYLDTYDAPLNSHEDVDIFISSFKDEYIVNEAKKDKEEEDVEVEEEDVEDIEVSDDGDIELEDEEVEVDIETEAPSDSNKDEVQDNLQLALKAAQELGDQKLVDQIGNTITFFTRTHIVGQDIEEVEQDLGLDVNEYSRDELRLQDEERNMKENDVTVTEEVLRFKKLAGIIK